MASAEAEVDATGTVLHRTRYDQSATEPVCTRICKALAAVETVDIEDLDFVLYEKLDVDALDTLVRKRSSTTDWQFEVTIDQYRLTIDSDGEVVVKAAD